ncbi:hypothetical protein BKA93DRAFT_752930 [Sparassis latifolia]
MTRWQGDSVRLMLVGLVDSWVPHLRAFCVTRSMLTSVDRKDIDLSVLVHAGQGVMFGGIGFHLVHWLTVDKGQRKLCANVVAFPQPVAEMYNILPPLHED